MARISSSRFVQKESPKAGDSFDVCYIYVLFVEFEDARNDKPCRLKYVVRAERYEEVLAIKFYASRDRKNINDKYSLAHNQMRPGAVMCLLKK